LVGTSLVAAFLSNPNHFAHFLSSSSNVGTSLAAAFLPLPET
jgi:hypothetical protein